ncbi:fatty acyl-CoA reductase 3-like [Macadamia integrifolia]|uniref:fatty acyl-CoA reductase 3-like n=1 Tax=Macadamia integrifolia TaxID=60698 RepID=UPI001C501764|nr:fatty acyl-CoA reductase 3-like [Macadamia integrifolia]
MELSGIVESLEQKTILVTGSTGFLAKLFVEKVLRVQPNVKRLFLLLRASDTNSALQRLHDEVIGKEVFKVLRDKYGDGLDSYISEKLIPVAGDIGSENLGVVDYSLREEMCREIDIIFNSAALTDFDERYDHALSTNTLGAKHVLDFAKQCPKLKMLLHVSTAYVAGEKEGLILENPFLLGETLNGTTGLDIEQEMKLVQERLNQLGAEEVTQKAQTLAMKDLGLERARMYGWPNTYVFTKAMGEMLLGHLKENIPLVIIRPTIITSTYKEPIPGWTEGLRTIDSLGVAYGKGKLPCFLGDPKSIIDLIPGDMVVNSIIVAMVTHMNQAGEFIYQVGSSIRNPTDFNKFQEYAFHYFSKNPLKNKSGMLVNVQRIAIFTDMDSFYRYVSIRYILPLKVFQLVNIAFCKYFQREYDNQNRKMAFVMRLVKLYKPYLFFKGVFDDLNTEKLRMAMEENHAEANMFCFDPRSIDWDDYFMNIHSPGVRKYVYKG